MRTCTYPAQYWSLRKYDHAQWSLVKVKSCHFKRWNCMASPVRTVPSGKEPRLASLEEIRREVDATKIELLRPWECALGAILYPPMLRDRQQWCNTNGWCVLLTLALKRPQGLCILLLFALKCGMQRQFLHILAESIEYHAR